MIFSRMRHVTVGLLCVSMVSCAHISASPPQQRQLFQAGLHVSITVATQSLVAFHPDIVPHLLAWLDAACGTVTGTTDVGTLQAVMREALTNTPMPEAMRALVADFIPVIVALMPVALQAAEMAVPDVQSVVIVAGDVCRWIEQAIPVSARLPAPAHAS